MAETEVVEGEKTVRSVRYSKDLYAWLLARSKRYNRSVQRENTYLLERLRNSPDVVRLLDEAPIEEQ